MLFVLFHWRLVVSVYVWRLGPLGRMLTLLVYIVRICIICIYVYVYVYLYVYVTYILCTYINNILYIYIYVLFKPSKYGLCHSKHGSFGCQVYMYVQNNQVELTLSSFGVVLLVICLFSTQVNHRRLCALLFFPTVEQLNLPFLLWTL